jgi:hypothetical protein
MEDCTFSVDFQSGGPERILEGNLAEREFVHVLIIILRLIPPSLFFLDNTDTSRRGGVEVYRRKILKTEGRIKKTKSTLSPYRVYIPISEFHLDPFAVGGLTIAVSRDKMIMLSISIIIINIRISAWKAPPSPKLSVISWILSEWLVV